MADADNADAYLSLAVSLSTTGRYMESLDVAQNAFNLFERVGDNDGAWRAAHNIGWLHYGLRNWRESIRASEQALKLNDSSVSTRFNLGLALLRIGELERAREEYERASSQADENALNSHAIKDLTAALAEDPTLRGAKEILEILEKKLDALTRRRSEAAVTGVLGSGGNDSLQLRA